MQDVFFFFCNLDPYTKTSLAFATFLFSFHDDLQPLVPSDALHAIGAFEVQSSEASCF